MYNTEIYCSRRLFQTVRESSRFVVIYLQRGFECSTRKEILKKSLLLFFRKKKKNRTQRYYNTRIYGAYNNTIISRTYNIKMYNVIRVNICLNASTWHTNARLFKYVRPAVICFNNTRITVRTPYHYYYRNNIYILKTLLIYKHKEYNDFLFYTSPSCDAVACLCTR